jgi:chaperonin GroEL
MVSKKIVDAGQMADKIKEGLHIIASIVARTLGPGGLPILIERAGQSVDGEPLPPMITKDGATVAEECAHEDPEVDLAIQTVKAICRKTNRIAGDGTTTAIVLGESIFLETLKELGAKTVSEPSLNPQLVKERVELAVKKVIELMSKVSTPVEDLNTIERIANISANGEKEIGAAIREAFDHVGAEGVVTVDEGSTSETVIQKVEGFQFQRGAEAQERFFNNKEMTKYEAQNVLVIIYDGKIDHNGKLIPVMNKVFIEHKKLGLTPPPLLVVANEFSVDTLQLLLINKVEAGLSICAVKGPNTTSVRTQMLDDLAVYLGGQRLGNGNKNLESAEFSIENDGGRPAYRGDLGFAKSVVIDRYTTTFYEGGGEDDAVKEKINQLKASEAYTFSDYDKSIIKDRIAALSRGIAKILVGGRTELEIKEKYHRIEDALNSSRAAIESGIIPGGGVVLYRIAGNLDQNDIGERILSRALTAPFFQIIYNIGVDPTSIDLDLIKKDESLVYDARDRRIVNAFEVGIIDPLKVTVTALQNATSITALLSTCGGGITYVRKA